jgi:hypothetical protein
MPAVKNKPLRRLHIEKQVLLPKITLRRWLRELQLLPGGVDKWRRQRELLEQRTRYYTPDEIRELLLLGKAPYYGAPGMVERRHTSACILYVVKLRQDTIDRAETELKYHERRN